MLKWILRAGTFVLASTMFWGTTQFWGHIPGVGLTAWGGTCLAFAAWLACWLPETEACCVPLEIEISPQMRIKAREWKPGELQALRQLIKESQEATP